MRAAWVRVASTVLAWGLLAAWSPSASATFTGGNGRIAFQRGTTIQIVEADGSGLEELLDAAVTPAWSPSGHRIAYAAYAAHGRGICIGNSRGKVLVKLTTNRTDALPSWSPDGKWLVFTRLTAQYRRLIMTIGVAGGPPTRLTFGSEPVWSPDGTQIAFASGGAIYSIHPDGSGITRLSPLGVFDASPDWSPDGTRIVFARYDTQSDDFFADLYTMNPDGSNVTRVTRTANYNEEFPVWSPQGDMFAFQVANRANTQLIGISKTDGSDFRTITHDSKEDVLPDWQPLL